MSPNFLSSKMRNFFLAAISNRPAIVRSLKSEMISACVLSTQIASPHASARRRSSEVVSTSAERHRFELLSVMRRRRYAVRCGVSGRAARSAKD